MYAAYCVAFVYVSTYVSEWVYPGPWPQKPVEEQKAVHTPFVNGNPPSSPPARQYLRIRDVHNIKTKYDQGNLRIVG